MKMTPAGALMHQVQTRPKSAAFVFHEEGWTYERLAVEAESLARGMAVRGVGPGDRVALHMMNRPEMLVAYYACFKLGAIAAPLRTAFKFTELAPILQRLKPALYIGDIGLMGAKIGGQEGYQVLIGGGADNDQRLARELISAIRFRDLAPKLERLLEACVASRENNETFLDFTQRHDIATLQSFCNQENA